MTPADGTIRDIEDLRDPIVTRYFSHCERRNVSTMDSVPKESRCRKRRTTLPLVVSQFSHSLECVRARKRPEHFHPDGRLLKLVKRAFDLRLILMALKIQEKQIPGFRTS